MPYINVNDAYILDNNGKQVDDAVDYALANSNRNLLDNAYFVGGGSQLGDGVFPINQRGQTSYQSQGTTIDRWKSNSPWGSIANVTLEEGGLVIAGRIEPSYPDSHVQLSQVIKTPPVGKTVTLSVLCDNVSPDSEGNYPQILCGSSVNKRITAAGLTSLTFVWPSAENSIGIVLDNGATQAASIRLQAAKLEIGSVSTLANDAPPDFGEELAKCQRYLYIPTFPLYAWTGTLAMATSATAFNWVINTPVPMRQGVIPTIGITASVYINGTAASNLSIVNAPVGNLVQISGTSAGMTNGQLYPVNTSANAVSVILSAEL